MHSPRFFKSQYAITTLQNAENPVHTFSFLSAAFYPANANMLKKAIRSEPDIASEIQSVGEIL
jgi:hypothetical protein